MVEAIDPCRPGNVADLEADIDPEEDAQTFDNSGDSTSDDDGVNGHDGREHYQSVGKSNLRKPETQPLGPQYKGSQVSRKSALEQEQKHDPFDGQGSEDDGGNLAVASDVDSFRNWDSPDRSDQHDNISESDEHRADTDDTSMSDENEEVGTGGNFGDEPDDRAELRRLMNEETKTVAASIAQATRADAEKGQAVKRQRHAFDSLLNCRIRLQPGLVAINSLQLIDENDLSVLIEDLDAHQAAEQAALRLWNTLDDLRQCLSDTRNSTKKQKRLEALPSTSNAEIWNHLQSAEADSLPHRTSILQKWSTKTQAATTQPISRRLNNAARQTTITDVLTEQLSNTTRLVKRTRMPRSCAPLHASRGITEASDIFDDADFYGVMLKELLEQRSIESASSVQVDQVAQQWQAAREAKTRKNVDTKASKGRKMRYTVHERLQNFMAPEDKASWGERRIDELFGSLLGQRMVLGESDAVGNGDVRHDKEEEALKLFRS